MNLVSKEPIPQILATSAGRGWNDVDAEFLAIPPGKTQTRVSGTHILGMHFSAPVHADCLVGGVRRRGLQKPGDLDFIPAGVEGTWEDDSACEILRLSLRPSVVGKIAEELGLEASKVDLKPLLGLRDARLDAVCWAIKADLAESEPSNPLYIDLLANALVVRLLELSAPKRPHVDQGGGSKLSAQQLRRLTEFIETNLDQKLRLSGLASVAGVSPTRLKTMFRSSTGTSVHQYVMTRRVEFARALLATSKMPIIEVALAAGFAHPSHMASTMRRMLGRTPSEIAQLRS